MKTTRSDARQVPILAISLLVLALLGCKAITQITPASQPAPATSVSTVVTAEIAELPATRSPTLTAAASPVGEGPASPVSSSLKLGHWANENGTHGEANVSFDLSDASNISNFSMSASFGTPTQGCTMEIDRLQMQVNEDGTFVISYSMEYADVETELGPAVMSLGIIPEGQPYEVLHISGNTTDTTMNGTYKVTVCSHVLYFDDNTGPWKAQWKNP